MAAAPLALRRPHHHADGSWSPQASPARPSSSARSSGWARRCATSARRGRNAHQGPVFRKGVKTASGRAHDEAARAGAAGDDARADLHASAGARHNARRRGRPARHAVVSRTTESQRDDDGEASRRWRRRRRWRLASGVELAGIELELVAEVGGAVVGELVAGGHELERGAPAHGARGARRDGEAVLHVGRRRRRARVVARRQDGGRRDDDGARRRERAARRARRPGDARSASRAATSTWRGRRARCGGGGSAPTSRSSTRWRRS